MGLSQEGAAVATLFNPEFRFQPSHGYADSDPQYLSLLRHHAPLRVRGRFGPVPSGWRREQCGALQTHWGQQALL